MTYAELVALIQDTVECDEDSFVEHIPDFVRQAEERIYRRVKMPKVRKVQTAPLSTRTLGTPSDFLAVDSLALLSGTTYTHLVPKEPDFIREAFPLSASTGQPTYYALLDNDTLVFGPTPDQTYTLEMAYTHKPESIVTAGTSWVGDNCENALLYGSLFAAYVYLKGEQDILQLYDSLFQEAVGVTKSLAEGKNRTDEWRNSPPRAPQ